MSGLGGEIAEGSGITPSSIRAMPSGRGHDSGMKISPVLTQIKCVLIDTEIHAHTHSLTHSLTHVGVSIYIEYIENY